MKLEIVRQQEVLGNDFKIYGDLENPLFLAKDVAEWIEHNKPNELTNLVEEDEKLMAIVSRSGQNREMWFLTEDGLYEVLMQSRKPIAKQFKKEVKKILKEVRMYGKYQVPTNLKQALQLALKQQEQIELQNAIIEQLQPKADYVDMILQSDSLVTVNQIAQDYGLSAQKLNRILAEEKIQYKQSKQWLMYSEYRQKGYVHSDTIKVQTEQGEIIKMHTKWTQKGRLFINEVLNARGVFGTVGNEKE